MDRRRGRVIPSTSDIALDNIARHFKLATFLYADLSGSTQMVKDLAWSESAEVYKTYLYCGSRLIRHFKGEVVAFDGDRVMGVFLGGQPVIEHVPDQLGAHRIGAAPLVAVRPRRHLIGNTVAASRSNTRSGLTPARRRLTLEALGV